MDQISLYRLFQIYQNIIDGDDPKYDAIVETMDLIWGGLWAKGGALFDRELNEEDLRACS
jgi:hypothetical protein